MPEGCGKAPSSSPLPSIVDSTYLLLERKEWGQHTPGPKLALLQSLGPSPPYQPRIPLLTVGEEIKVQQGEPLTRGTQLFAKPQLLGYDTSVVYRD